MHSSPTPRIWEILAAHPQPEDDWASSATAGKPEQQHCVLDGEPSMRDPRGLGQVDSDEVAAQPTK